MDGDRREGVVLSQAVRTVGQTGSTNADMLALAVQGAAEGSWLRAERQTGGRGRAGRSWDSPAGNLYTSTLVRLRPGDPPAATLALVSAVAVEQVVSELIDAAAVPRPIHELHRSPAAPPRAQLKWPNDVLVGGAKLCGILLERSGDAVVIGIGVNVGDHPRHLDRATTSLAEQGVSVTPAALVDRLVAAFATWVAEWRVDLMRIVERWVARAHPAGTALTLSLPDGTALAGTFAGLAADGALLLRHGGGELRAIHAADVFLL